MPAEHHPSLSLEVPQAGKSIYPPGTQARSLPTLTSALGSVWLLLPPPTLAHRALFKVRRAWQCHLLDFCTQRHAGLPSELGQVSPKMAGQHQTLESTGKEEAICSGSWLPNWHIPQVVI